VIKNIKLFHPRFKLRTVVLVILLLNVSLGLSQNRAHSDHWQSRNKQFNLEMDSLDHVDNVFLGNSITEGFDLEYYFPDHELANRGIVADHIDGLMQRLENSALALKPNNLFLMIGINDIGDRRDDEYLKKMFSVLIDNLTHALPETEIYLHSILPTSPRWKNCPPDQIRRMNLFLERLAKERGLTYVDLHPLFLNESGEFIHPDLTRDGLHLNALGYEIWVDQIRGYLK